MTTQPFHSLHDAFADLPDPRMDRTNDHRLLVSVAIAVCRNVRGK